VVADANLKHAVAQFVDASLLNWARALVALGNINALTSGLRELIKCFNVEVTCWIGLICAAHMADSSMHH
jgi:hypothetical protein